MVTRVSVVLPVALTVLAVAAVTVLGLLVVSPGSARADVKDDLAKILDDTKQEAQSDVCKLAQPVGQLTAGC